MHLPQKRMRVAVVIPCYRVTRHVRIFCTPTGGVCYRFWNDLCQWRLMAQLVIARL